MSARLDQLDYYTLLGVPPDADERAVRRAFRAFARKYHPDRFARETEEQREKATAIYRRGSEGLQVLCDPAARELYDRALKKGILRLTAEQRDGAQRRKDARREKKVSKPQIKSVEAKAYYEKAISLVGRKEHREAWKALRKALDIEPKSERIKKALAEVDALIRRGG